MRNGTLHVLFGFFAALFVASQANIIAGLGPVAAEMFQLQLTLSADTFQSIVDGWGADELARYRTHFAWDTVHPLIYGGLLVLWTLVVHRRRPFSARGLRRMLTLSIAPVVLDYVENAFHLYLEANREAINSSTVLIAGLAANVKWLCAALAVVLLLLASIRAVLARKPRPVPNPVLVQASPLTPSPDAEQESEAPSEEPAR